MRFPLVVLAASFALLHCARGFVLSGSSVRSRGSARSELDRTYSRGIRSNTNTAMKRRPASGRGSSPLAMSDRLTVSREHRYFRHMRVFGACFRGVCGDDAHSSSSGVVKSQVYMIRFMFVSTHYRVPTPGSLDPQVLYIIEPSGGRSSVLLIVLIDTAAMMMCTVDT